MNVIFCLSYLSVPHTLTLIKSSGSDFLVISSNPQLIHFFEEIYPGKVDRVPSFSLSMNNFKGLLLLPIKWFWISKMKHRTWTKFKSIQNCNVYFFFNTAAYSHAWLLYKLSKCNQMYYQEDIDLSSYNIDNSVFSLITKYFIRFVHKEEVYPINLGNGLISYKMEEKFLSKLKAEYASIKLDYIGLSKWLNGRITLPKGDVLMLSNWMPEHGVGKDEHIQASDRLIKTLREMGYTPHFKMHSRAEMKYSLEKTLFEVPKYYPASMLLNYKVFIGYVTSALTESANNGLMAISLIDYIPSENHERKEAMKIYLNKNLIGNAKIHFPKNNSELIEILETNAYHAADNDI